MRVSKDVDVLSTYVGKAFLVRRQPAPWRARARRVAEVAQFVILYVLAAALSAIAITESGIDVSLLPLG